MNLRKYRIKNKFLLALIAYKVHLFPIFLGILILSLYQKYNSLEESVAKNQIILSQIYGEEITHLEAIAVKVTSYNPVRSQTDSTPLIGADGRLVMPGMVAISKDLERDYGIKLGDRIILRGYGAFTVKDYMNPRIKNCVDIISFIPKWSDNFGCRKTLMFYERSSK